MAALVNARLAQLDVDERRIAEQVVATLGPTGRHRRPSGSLDGATSKAALATRQSVRDCGVCARAHEARHPRRGTARSLARAFEPKPARPVFSVSGNGGSLAAGEGRATAELAEG